MNQSASKTPGYFKVGKLTSILEVLHHVPNSGRFPVLRALVDVAGTSHEVALKILPAKAVANECAANLVGNHLGFQVLDPFLVTTKPEYLEEIKLDLKGPPVFFATRLSKIKTLKANPAVKDFEFWIQGLSSSWFQGTFVFDVLVGNGDRILENLFFMEVEGKDQYVLLDHQMCLFGADWTAVNLRNNKGKIGDNFLNKRLALCTEQNLDQIMETANSLQGKTTPEILSPLEVLVDLGLLDQDELKSVFEFLTWRSENLPTLVMKQINLERPYPRLSMGGVF